MKNIPLKPAEILLPEKTDMTLWSVVACDQYTSEPSYWEDVSKEVGEAPSTLKLVLPEIYLSGNDEDKRIKNINGTMREYLDSSMLRAYPDSIFFVSRTLRNGTVRNGLVAAVDLMEYSYEKGSQSLIRATEGTVLDRIPPRVRVRVNAALELPHVMLLIDDEKKSVIEPIADSIENEQLIYSFPLMQNSGSIKGYRLCEKSCGKVISAIERLADRDAFEQKYTADKGTLLFAVGDGNHSLASAKAHYEALKNSMDEADWLAHPARFALVEIVNLHDDSLQFEPIHRVVFSADTKHFRDELHKFYSISEDTCEQSFTCILGGQKERFNIQNPSSNLTVGSVQNFLDFYTENFGGSVDYIHGENVVEELAKNADTIGILLPSMKKNELFPTVIKDGALPRKTFSMGHACDKRFYLEVRRIIK